jgi:hypothetical protein
VIIIRSAMSRAALIPVLAITIAAAAQAQQAIQWRVQSGGNGHWYAAEYQFRPWPAAMLNAQSLGGHLATTTSQAELSFIRPLIDNALGADYWLGASRGATPGTWAWVTGEPFNFTRWEPGAPDNGPASTCLEVIGRPQLAGFGMWNDEVATAGGPGNYSIVEWSADCNNDGITDFGQCRDGTLPDYNGNNVPDCCESGSPCVVASYPVQWRLSVGGNGHWYAATESWTGWVAARQSASRRGGDLATIASQAESNFLCTSVLRTAAGNGSALWIGLHLADGSWRWISGEPLVWTNWEASNPGGGAETVGWVFGANHPSPGVQCTWNDANGAAHSYPGLVEWSADCNADGIVDYGQILQGQLPDTNSNGIPDGCECSTSPTLPACCTGDLNQDRFIDGADLGILLNAWGTCSGTCPADLNRDGFVDGSDLGTLLGRWGGCP